MIIDQIHVVGISILEAEDDTLITGDRDGPEASKIPAQGVKLETGKRHVLYATCLIQSSENTSDLTEISCGKPAAVAFFIKQPKAAVLQRSYHLDTLG